MRNAIKTKSRLRYAYVCVGPAVSAKRKKTKQNKAVSMRLTETTLRTNVRWMQNKANTTVTQTLSCSDRIECTRACGTLGAVSGDDVMYT